MQFYPEPSFSRYFCSVSMVRMFGANFLMLCSTYLGVESRHGSSADMYMYFDIIYVVVCKYKYTETAYLIVL